MIASKDLPIGSRGLGKSKARLRQLRNYVQSRSWLSLPVIRRLRCMQLRGVTGVYPKRDRGTSVVRHYWHEFLVDHREGIRGDALEIGNSGTVLEYGG